MLGYAGKMNRNNDSDKRFAIVACGIVLALVTSCRKAEEEPSRTAEESSLSEKAESVAKSSGVAETNAVLTKSEAYEKEFLRFALGAHMTVDVVSHGINKLCNEIAKNVDEKEAVRLFDLLGDMALKQPLLDTSYYKQENHLLKLWHLTKNAFVFAQHRRQDSFEDWNRLFLFFKRYTDEITEVEQRLNTSQRLGSRQESQLKSYLRSLKSELKQEVYEFRRFFFPSLSEGLTEEQKADILRRFEEIEKYTVSPKRKDLGMPIQSTTNTPVNASGNGATKGSE